MFEQYIKSFDEIISAKAGDLDKCKAQAEQAEADVRKAEDNMNEAVLSGDDKAYFKAKDARDKAQTLLNMCNTRIDVLENGPLINKETFEKYVAEIKGKLTEATDADKKEALELCERLLEIAERNSTMLKEGNTVLAKLQREVYRYADCKRARRTGNIIITPLMFIDKNSLNGWANMALRSTQYKDMVDSIGD